MQTLSLCETCAPSRLSSRSSGVCLTDSRATATIHRIGASLAADHKGVRTTDGTPVAGLARHGRPAVYPLSGVLPSSCATPATPDTPRDRPRLRRRCPARP
jgi:hypothetical protein